MSTLPTPNVLRRTLDELRLGTWKIGKEKDDNPENKIFETKSTDSLSNVVEIFSKAEISAVPVFDSNRRLVDTLTKYDLIYFLTGKEIDIDFESVTVEEILKKRGPVSCLEFLKISAEFGKFPKDFLIIF